MAKFDGTSRCGVRGLEPWNNFTSCKWLNCEISVRRFLQIF